MLFVQKFIPATVQHDFANRGEERAGVLNFLSRWF